MYKSFKDIPEKSQNNPENEICIHLNYLLRWHPLLEKNFFAHQMYLSTFLPILSHRRIKRVCLLPFTA